MGDWSNVESAGMLEEEDGVMHETPRWHPFYWLGLRYRQRCGSSYVGYWWEYARPRTVARRELEKLYGKD